MSHRFLVALIALLAGLIACARAPAADREIVYAEGIELSAFSANSAGTQKIQHAGAIEFDAFNRKFRLRLDSNEKLLRLLPAATRNKLTGSTLLAGVLEDSPGSWVRLSVVNGRYQGAIWDGVELYAIEPTAGIANELRTPLLRPKTHAMYRLSDTRGGSSDQACGTGDDVEQKQEVPSYKALLRELQSMNVGGAAEEIEVALIADYEFTTAHGSGTVADMASRMNLVDGIFASQVGVSIVPTDFITYTSNTDPYTTSTASLLLQQLSEHRNADPVIRSRGLAHLITGRELDGNYVGFAYTGTLCQAESGVSLSESSSFFDSALVIAHELGHNFGAPHDGQAGSACAATPQGFLMSPTFNGSSLFSSCSVERMRGVIGAASCIRAATVRDVAVEVQAEQMQVARGQPFDFVATLSSVGQAPAVNVVASTPFYPDFDVLSAFIENGACQIGTEEVVCQIEQLAAGQSARMQLQLSPRYETERYPLSVRVESSGDANATNNSDTLTLRVVSGVSIDMQLSPQPLTQDANIPSEISVAVTSAGIRGLSGATVQGSMDAEILSVTIDSGSCSHQVDNYQCTLGALDSSDARLIRIQFVSRTAGVRTGRVIFRSDDASAPLYRTEQFEYSVRALRDIGIVLSSSAQLLTIGNTVQTDAIVRSNGVQTVENVRVRVFPGAPLSSELQVDAGVECTEAGGFWSCALGNMLPGESRALHIISRSEVPAQGSVSVLVEEPSADDDPSNDWPSNQIEARFRSDAIVSVSDQFSTYDQRESLFTAQIGSIGTDSINSLIATVSIPPGFLIHSADLESQACSISTNEVTCALPALGPDENALLSIRYTAPLPGTFAGEISVSSPEDGDLSNNTVSITFTVSPDVNVILRGPQSHPAVFANDVFTVQYQISTGRYVSPGVKLSVSVDPQILEDATATANCAPTASSIDCDLGDLPANYTETVTLRLRPTARQLLRIWATVFAEVDRELADNVHSLDVDVYPRANAALSVAQVPTGGYVDLPTQIALRISSDEYLVSPRIRLAVGAGVIAQVALSGAGNCVWTEPGYECELSAVTKDVDLHLQFVPLAAGHLSMVAQLVALNDVTPENNSQTLNLQVANTPSTSPNPSPSPVPAGGGTGGGGGGGSVTLSLLTGLLTLRALSFIYRHRRRSRVL